VKKIVVVGGGHAAAQFCASVIEKKQAIKLTVVTDEGYLPYQRPPLSKTFIKEEQPQPAWLRPASFYTDNRIETHINTRVTAIDRNQKTLLLSSGKTLPYDILVLATGTRARTLSLLESAPYSNVFMLRNMNDASGLRVKMCDASAVLVIGGGFIGLELSATARSLGKEVRVLEAAPRLLGRSVSKEVSDYLLRKHRSNGVDVLLEASVDRFEECDGDIAAAWVNGQRYPSDVVVVGVGAVPNTELAETAGLACDNGVTVNEFMQTSDPAIYAIGDCASFPYSAFGCRIRLESVQNANDHARCAARAICDDPSPYAALPWFWSDQGEVRVQIAGVAHAADERVVRGSPTDDKFSVLYFSNGVLTCAESINTPADHMAARKLIVSGLEIDRERAVDPMQGLKDLVVAV